MIAQRSRPHLVYDKSFACGEMAAECVWLSVGGSGQMGEGNRGLVGGVDEGGAGGERLEDK